MGPHSNECGNAAGCAGSRGKVAGFNGAALQRVRKCGFNSAYFRMAAWLQWGRTPTSAEMSEAR